MIPGDVGDRIEPLTTRDMKTFEFDNEDRQKVEELRKWWRVSIFFYQLSRYDIFLKYLHSYLFHRLSNENAA